MRTSLRSGGLPHNPYVVFTDLTISLACIFLIYAMSTSESLAGVTRVARQQVILDELTKEFHKRYPGGYVQEPDPNGSIKDSVWTFWESSKVEEVQASPKLEQNRRVGSGHRIMVIWQNAGLQRVELLDSPFDPGKFEILKGDREALFLNVAQIVSKAYKQYDYLFLWGIAEPEEIAGGDRKAAIVLSTNRAGKDFDQLQNAAITLSRNRANKAYDYLLTKGVILPYGDKQSNDLYIRPKWVPPTGQGFLYSEGEPRGRVDFVLFYPDALENNGKQPG